MSARKRVDEKGKVDAELFFERCISHRLSFDHFCIAEGKINQVVQKLQVLQNLGGLLYGNCMVGDYVQGAGGEKLKVDFFIGKAVKYGISLGFRKEHGLNIPVTLYQRNVKELINPKNPVLIIYRKKWDDAMYHEITCCKGRKRLSGIEIPAYVSHHAVFIKR